MCDLQAEEERDGSDRSDDPVDDHTVHDGPRGGNRLKERVQARRQIIDDQGPQLADGTTITTTAYMIWCVYTYKIAKECNEAERDRGSRQAIMLKKST